MATVTLDLPGTRYDITVQPGLLSNAGTMLRQPSKSKRAGIVTDTEVGPRHLAALERSLQ